MTDPAEDKIKFRRSLHAHARESFGKGWSAAQWEEWISRFRVGHVDALGPAEVAAIVYDVWLSARKKR